MIPPATELDGGCADEGAPICQAETKEGEGDTMRRRK